MENFFIEVDNKSFTIFSNKPENKVLYSTTEKVLHHYLFDYKNVSFCLMIREDSVFIINLRDNFIFPISTKVHTNYFRIYGDILVLLEVNNMKHAYTFYDIRNILDSNVVKVFTLPCKNNVYEIIRNIIFYKINILNFTNDSTKFTFGKYVLI